jgi:hypothetical protein
MANPAGKAGKIAENCQLAIFDYYFYKTIAWLTFYRTALRLLKHCVITRRSARQGTAMVHAMFQKS